MITPFMVLYAVQDALVKPMPGKRRRPASPSRARPRDGLTTTSCCATASSSTTASRLPRRTSSSRTSAIAARGRLHEGACRVDRDTRPAPYPFRLKEPWPDFLTFYASATGAGWVVPKKYVEKVGEDGFKKAPIGAGPYKFVSFTPGVELVLEAFEGYWRKAPSVKRLVLKVSRRRRRGSRR